MMIPSFATARGRSRHQTPTPIAVCYWKTNFSLPIDLSPFTHRNW